MRLKPVPLGAMSHASPPIPKDKRLFCDAHLGSVTSGRSILGWSRPAGAANHPRWPDRAEPGGAIILSPSRLIAAA